MREENAVVDREGATQSSAQTGQPDPKTRLGPCVDIWVAARWADRLIYLKTASETRAQLTFAR